MKEIDRLLNGSKVVVFFDFEGTQFTQEIIAIGAVKCVLDNKNQIKKIYPGFKYYVKAHGEVGKVVTKLTGITDEKIAKDGINFLYAMKYFDKYVGHHHNIKFISYGNYDLRMLHQTSLIASISEDEFVKSIYKNYIDFSAVLSRYVKSEHGTQLSLLDALSTFDVFPEGEPHDPLFDAKNLMYLYRAFLKNKAKLIAEYEKLLLNHHSYPRPISQIIKELKNKGSVTIEDLKKNIEEDI